MSLLVAVHCLLIPEIRVSEEEVLILPVEMMEDASIPPPLPPLPLSPFATLAPPPPPEPHAVDEPSPADAVPENVVNENLVALAAAESDIAAAEMAFAADSPALTYASLGPRSLAAQKR